MVDWPPVTAGESATGTPVGAVPPRLTTGPPVEGSAIRSSSGLCGPDPSGSTGPPRPGAWRPFFRKRSPVIAGSLRVHTLGQYSLRPLQRRSARPHSLARRETGAGACGQVGVTTCRREPRTGLGYNLGRGGGSRRHVVTPTWPQAPAPVSLRAREWGRALRRCRGRRLYCPNVCTRSDPAITGERFRKNGRHAPGRGGPVEPDGSGPHSPDDERIAEPSTGGPVVKRGGTAPTGVPVALSPAVTGGQSTMEDPREQAHPRRRRLPAHRPVR
ncbi:Uncharacterised protein [Clostridium paraputrificum]|nr:Uncharacterised protein [Clostridium paraputrificum]